MIQQSFKNDKATVYLVATPIGNLKEMTPRALEILETVDYVAAEDTRTAKKLLSHFNITTKLISHHVHNEHESTKGLIQLLQDGHNIALVSDAGYPLISDPGQTFVSAVVEAGYNVVPVSGASAFLNAVVASGLVVQPFAFMGFLEAKESQLRKQLIENKDLNMTTVYYLSVHKLEQTLEIILDVLGDRKICLARELTKLHEAFIRGSVSKVLEEIDAVKGEFVLVVEAANHEEALDLEALGHLVDKQIEQGASVSRAISSVAKANGISKNELYASYHEAK